MKTLLRWGWGCWALLLVLDVSDSPARLSAAEEFKPAAVLSFSSLEKSLPDVRYLLTILGQEAYAKHVQTFGTAFTGGVDKKRPAGAFVVSHDGEMEWLVFVPVTDLKELLAIYQPYIGDPEDDGDGVLKLVFENPWYLKEQKGWAYLALNKSLLERLPADPAVWLGDLPKQYNVALKLLLKNITAEAKEGVLTALQKSKEEQLAALAEIADPKAREETAAGIRWGVSLVEGAFREMLVAEEFVLGFHINATDKKLTLEMANRAEKDSPQARQQAANREFRTQLAGLRVPEAALQWNYTARLDQAETKRVREMMEGVSTWASSSLQWDYKNDEERRAGETLDKEFKTLITSIIESREVDVGAAVVVRDKEWGTVIGGRVADPAIAKRLFAAGAVPLEKLTAAETPKREELTEGAWKYEVWNHNTKPDTYESRTYGPTVQRVLAVNGSYVLIAIGNKALDLTRRVVADSSEDKQPAAKEVPAVQLQISCSRLLGSLTKHNLLLASAAWYLGVTNTLNNSNDQLTFVTLYRDREQLHRLEIGEGIIKLLGPVVIEGLTQGFAPAAPEE